MYRLPRSAASIPRKDFMDRYKYLKQLSVNYPTIAKASTEIINLSSILSLPKGTEHFITDLHGEYEQVLHVLKNGSGSIRQKIDDEFQNMMSERERRILATLIYYPEQKLDQIEAQEEYLEDWYKLTLHRLIQIARNASSKYTRSKVRKALPEEFAYVMEELLHEREGVQDKEAYYNEIIQTIIRIGRARACIIAFCNLIQRLVIDHLHVIGDIFDRGPGAHIVMDRLMEYHSIDFQWGNHDVAWMGAASGHLACIANVIRLSARYGNLDTLEDGYGINLIPLVRFALDTYRNDPCECFDVQYRGHSYELQDLDMDQKMHKAIAVIQFKLEGQIIKNHPEFGMESRLLLDKINFKNWTVNIDDKDYALEDTHFPTIDPTDPYALSPEEASVMERIRTAFIHCEKLQKHVHFLFTKGSLYLRYNSNLLYHGCIPFNEDGTFRSAEIAGSTYSGKALYDVLETYARKGYYLRKGLEKAYGQDILWYLWSSEHSPLFGKEKMATFERYLISDKSVQMERKNYYYQLIEKDEIVDKIFDEFEMDRRTSHIINGHVPVEVKKGETPIHCHGRVLIIDGGFSKPYHDKTGTAGYTLIYNSQGMRLVAHKPFTSRDVVIQKEQDIHSDFMIVEQAPKRIIVADTDNGKRLKETIQDLEELLEAYRSGAIRER